jgi:hypothetical protein
MAEITTVIKIIISFASCHISGIINRDKMKLTLKYKNVSSIIDYIRMIHSVILEWK